MLDGRATFEIDPHQGQAELMARLPSRLRGYAAWLPESWQIVVVVDRDDDDCRRPKRSLDDIAEACGLAHRRDDGRRRVLNRIAIEEFEAWYFGDWHAVRAAYPRARKNTAARARYRDGDGIGGGTWEAFERELQRAGDFEGGLRKIEAAREVGRHFSVGRCSSRSFRHLAQALDAAARP